MRSGALAQRPASPRRVGQMDRPGKAVDRSAPDFGPNLKGERPHEYQKEAIRWMRERPRCLLGDDLGLGKTVMALRTLGKRPRAIIVCPASVSMTWQDEGKKWRPDLKVTVSKKLRRPDEGEVLVLSYGALPELDDWTTRLTDEPMRDVDLFFDEAHRTKNEEAFCTQKARKLGAQCKTRRGLTATPMLGNAEDLWGVLFSLGLVGEAFPEGRDFYVEMCGGKPRFTKVRGKLKRIGFEWGEVNPAVKERLKRVMLRRLADDVLDELPEKQLIDIKVPAPESLVPFLSKVKEEWDRVDPDKLPPFELLSEAMAALARAKTPYAVEWVDEHASDEQPLLVFSSHLDPILAVGKLKGAAIITGEKSGPAAIKQRRRIVDAFQAGKHRILAMTIQTGGAGLNLQRAAGVLFVDRDYTPGMNAQAFGRARRQGNVRERVVCWRMLSDHPLDLHLSMILDKKEIAITAAVG